MTVGTIDRKDFNMACSLPLFELNIGLSAGSICHHNDTTTPGYSLNEEGEPREKQTVRCCFTALRSGLPLGVDARLSTFDNKQDFISSGRVLKDVKNAKFQAFIVIHASLAVISKFLREMIFISVAEGIGTIVILKPFPAIEEALVASSTMINNVIKFDVGLGRRLDRFRGEVYRQNCRKVNTTSRDNGNISLLRFGR